LFHVSEEPGIATFEPRKPKRNDLDKERGLVWALEERCLPNFLTPRQCPRVTYHAAERSSRDDIDRFFSSPARHCVAIEHGWFERMRGARLFLYEFDPSNFALQDRQAGYYVSERTEAPVSVTEIGDLFGALFERGAEVRLLGGLWNLADAVKESTLNWSLCRMANAAPRA